MNARRTRLVATCAALSLSAAALAGCAGPDDSASPPPSPSESPTPSPSPSLAAVPDIGEGEIARMVRTENGPGGVPETALTTSGAIVADATYRIEGACLGGAQIEFDILSASLGDSGETLVSGAIACDGSVQDAGSWSVPYDGPAQFSPTSVDGETDGWVVMVPARS